ncbi:MAG: hypothetical protein ACR2G4_08390 [Pyrinomonadaceae bacterium]
MFTAKTEKEDAADRRTLTARKIYLSAPRAFDGAQQEEAERDFFASLQLKNGTYKLTCRRRFDDLNALVSKLLPPARPLQMMDVAVSSGVSTLEWIESLEQAGIDHHMTAGDLTTKGFLLSINEDLHMLVDDTGYPLQFDVCGTAVPNPPRRRYGTLYFLPLRLMRKKLAKHFAELREACAGAPAGALVKKHGIECRPVALVSPQLQPSPKLEVIEDDILSNTKLAGSFHVLRAANILNKAYFDDETLVAILVNLRARLRRGGLLIVCRTNDRNANNATIFTLHEAGRFEATARLGEGSEVESLVLNLPSDSSGSISEDKL